MLIASSPPRDPRKNITLDSDSPGFTPINVPKGDDGKYLYWAPPMKECDCGTPDEGRHIRYKWPCAYYRKDQDNESTGGRGLGKGKGAFKGKGAYKGKGGKGKGKWQTANVTEDQFNAAIATIKSATPTASSSPSTVDAFEKAESVISSTTASSSSTKQSCNVAEYGNAIDLEVLLNSTTLRSDLNDFFSEKSDTTIAPDTSDRHSRKVFPHYDCFELAPRLCEITYNARSRVLGTDLIANRWSDDSALLPINLTELREPCSIFIRRDFSHPSQHATQLWNLQRSELGTREWLELPNVHAVSRDFSGIEHERLCESVETCIEDAMNFIHHKHARRQSLPCTTTCDCSHADVAPTPTLPGDSIH